MDARWQATQILGFQASLAWLDARFDDYENGGCTAAQFLEEEQAEGTRLNCNQDLSGAKAFLAPEWTATFSSIMTIPLGDRFLFDGKLDFNFRDDFFLDADNDPNIVQHAYTLVNLQLGLSSNAENWRIGVLVKNLTDKEYSSQATDIPLTDGDYYKMTAPPRSLALQASLVF